MTNRWMKGMHRTDPINDILLKEKGLFYGFLGSILILSFIIVLGWRMIHHSFIIMNHSIEWIVLFQGILMCVTSWKIHTIKQAISDDKNANEFCKIFELIELIHQDKNQSDIPWITFDDKTVGTAVESYLHEQALKLMEMEKIPWRRKHVEKMRQKFSKEFEALTSLMLLPSDYSRYFTTKPA